MILIKPETPRMVTLMNMHEVNHGPGMANYYSNINPF